MKNIFFVAFICASNFLLAQNENDKTVYLDSLERKTNQGDHIYTRIIKDYALEKSKYKVFEYFKSGQLRKEFTLKDKTDLNSKTEITTLYFENGNKRSEEQLSDTETGTDTITHWHEGGEIYQEITSDKKTKISTQTTYYVNGKKQSVEKNNLSIPNTGLNNIIVQAWNKNNIQTVRNGKGKYQIEDSFKKIYGAVKDSLKNGEWIEENKITGEKIIEKFSNGKFIKGKRVSANGETITYDQQEVQSMPKYGYSDFSQFLASFFRYSNEAYEKKINGKVILEFTVEENGSINNILVIKSMGYGLDEEAIRLVSIYKKWEPGKIRGKNIRSRYYLPLRLSAQ